MAASDYGPLYAAAGRQYNVDPALLRAVVSTESGGDPNAVSSAGARGVAQLMPATAASLGVTDPTDPAQAIPGAAKLLAENLDRYGNVADALHAYHGGTDQSNWGPKTQAYAGKVMAALQQPMAQPAAAQVPDVFTQAFGAPKQSGATTTDAAPAGIPDVFSQAFGDLSKKGPPLVSGQSPPSDYIPADAPVGPKGAQWIRDLVADEPGKSYPSHTFLESLVPLAKDNATGAVSLAVPQAAKSLVRGVADLSEGTANALSGIPQPNQLSPDASNALMTIAGMRLGGAAPSAAAANTYIRDNNFLGRNAEVPAGNPLTAAPAAGGNLLTQGSEQPMAAPSLATPDGVPSAVEGAPGTAPEPAAAAAPAAPAASAPAAGGAKIKIPKSLLPIVTQSQAEAQADRILATFAKNGPTELNAAELVPGSQPTLSQATGNSGIAALEKGYQANPQFNNALATIKDNAAKARVQALDAITGNAQDIEAAEAARDTATEGLRTQAFSNASPVDSAPVAKLIDDILASPDGQRPSVVSALTPFRDQIAQKVGDGTYERYQNDPEQLYGVRKAINDALSPQAARDTASGQIAARQLIQVRDALDNVIEQGAPGFKNYMTTYAEQSKPIDAMKYLQKANLTDRDGNITTAKLDSTIKAIQNKQNLNGVNDASSVSGDQLKQLQNLRADMRRSAPPVSGRVPGSDSFQNLGSNGLIQKLTGNPLINLGIGGVAGVGGIPAAVLTYGAKVGYRSMAARADRMVEDALQNRLLNPHLGANALTSIAKPGR